MNILFDQGTPVPLRKSLLNHSVTTVFEMGWNTLENGDLIKTAEGEGYDILVTTDQNLKYQQNLRGRRIAIIVLLSTSWPRIQKVLADIVQAVESAKPGSYTEIPI